jgi:hypothetical protein
MTTSNTLRLLQHATSKLDELSHRIAGAEIREQRERREAQARADDAAYLTSREHLIDVQAAKREYQARADDALQPWGERAPPSIAGESINGYRRRLAGTLQQRLPEGDQLRRLDFDRLPQDAYDGFEPQLYPKVAAAADRPDSASAGELREVVRVDPKNGHKVHLFFGRESFVKEMGRPGRRVVSFRTDQGFVDASGRGLR